MFLILLMCMKSFNILRLTLLEKREVFINSVSAGLSIILYAMGRGTGLFPFGDEIFFQCMKLLQSLNREEFG